MLGNNAFDGHYAPFGKTAYFHCAPLHFFFPPICSWWKQGGWCGESNAIHAQLGQCSADPHPVPSQIVISPSRSLTCNQSVLMLNLKVVWKKLFVSCKLEDPVLSGPQCGDFCFAQALVEYFFIGYEGPKLLESRRVFYSVYSKDQWWLFISLAIRWPKSD